MEITVRDGVSISEYQIAVLKDYLLKERPELTLVEVVATDTPEASFADYYYGNITDSEGATDEVSWWYHDTFDYNLTIGEFLD
jgi:hypothetical protein